MINRCYICLIFNILKIKFYKKIINFKIKMYILLFENIHLKYCKIYLSLHREMSSN